MYRYYFFLKKKQIKNLLNYIKYVPIKYVFILLYLFYNIGLVKISILKQNIYYQNK